MRGRGERGPRRRRSPDLGSGLLRCVAPTVAPGTTRDPPKALRRGEEEERIGPERKLEPVWVGKGEGEKEEMTRRLQRSAQT